VSIPSTIAHSIAVVSHLCNVVGYANRYACTSLDGPTCDFVNGAESPAVDASGITKSLASLVNKLAASLAKGIKKEINSAVAGAAGATGATGTAPLG
jgi:hypothetical protein